MTTIDFEEDWGDLKGGLKPVIRLTKGSDLLSALEDACQAGAADLRVSFEAHRGKPVTTELMGEMITQAVPLFMEQWVAALKGKNLSGLIEIILDGQGLEPAEMKAFIRAIPESLIRRICSSEVGTWTGVHALMGVEKAFRDRRLTEDYRLERDSGSGGRIFFEFTPKGGQNVRLFLDEERGEGLPPV